MKATNPEAIRLIQNPSLWLLAIAGGLIAIDLSLSWRSAPDLSQLSMSLLCWGAVLSLLWEKRHTLSLESDVLSSGAGLLLIGFVLLRSLLMTSFDSVFELLPLISGIGLALVASGVKRLGQYRQELLIILALNIPIGLVINRIELLSNATAKFATMLLTYCGVEVYRQGINIFIPPRGAVEVAAGCSGWETIFPLLQLSVLFLVMFPTGLIAKICVPLMAVSIAFIVNGVRVAIMALLVAYSTQETFEYWHLGTGSQIFFLIATLMFGCVCYVVSQNAHPARQDHRELSES